MVGMCIYLYIYSTQATQETLLLDQQAVPSSCVLCLRCDIMIVLLTTEHICDRIVHRPMYIEIQPHGIAWILRTETDSAVRLVIDQPIVEVQASTPADTVTKRAYLQDHHWSYRRQHQH